MEGIVNRQRVDRRVLHREQGDAIAINSLGNCHGDESTCRNRKRWTFVVQLVLFCGVFWPFCSSTGSYGLQMPSHHADGRPILVVTDLDGTLWDTHQSIHASTLAAVAELDARGIPLLVATGRRQSSTRSGFALNDFWRPAIMLNGTIGVDHPSEEAFHQHTFSVDEGNAVLEAFAECGHVPCVYGSDGFTYLADDATTSPRHRSGMIGGLSDVRRADPAPLVADELVLGFSIIGVELDGLESLAPRLRDFGMFVDTYQDPLYGGWSVMAQPPGVSKLTGIEAFVEHRGIDNPYVIAMGDGGNDVEMIKGADLGLAIEGGDDAVVAAADQTIAGPAQGGWAEVIGHIDQVQ